MTVRLLEHPRGTVLLVRAHAGSRRNGILGVRERMLRVAVTVAPEKGKANRAIVNLLSNILEVPKTSIELMAGETSSQKRFLITGKTVEEVRSAIAPHVDEESA